MKVTTDDTSVITGAISTSVPKGHSLLQGQTFSFDVSVNSKPEVSLEVLV